MAEMRGEYAIADTDAVETPAVVVYPKLVRENLRRVLQMVQSPGRLRPHSKTHKTAELTRMELEAGITRHKCATLAEAELLAETGAEDVLIAYPLVGPNIARIVALADRFREVRFRTLIDHPAPLESLQTAAARAKQSIDVLLDLDVGMGRTGISIGPSARRLYARIADSSGLTAGGLHVYDGHVRNADVNERRAIVRKIWGEVRDFIAELESDGLSVPRIVAGGTPTFPCWNEIAAEDPRVECSPGTFLLNDASYHATYLDLPLPPAALVVGRVVSMPRPGQLTLDVGSKAVAADPPLAGRLHLLNVPGAELIKQNEEHLVVATPSAASFSPGDFIYAAPGHICPTCALHRELLAVEEGRVVGRWAVRARDRTLHP